MLNRNNNNRFPAGAAYTIAHLNNPSRLSVIFPLLLRRLRALLWKSLTGNVIVVILDSVIAITALSSRALFTKLVTIKGGAHLIGSFVKFGNVYNYFVLL